MYGHARLATVPAKRAITTHCMSHPPFRPRGTGITLIELLVVIAIAAILAGIAVPSFNDTIRRNRIDTAANTFLNALNYARTEAIRRNTYIALRKSGSQWENGYVAFVDSNANGTIDTGEETIRTWQGLPTGYTLRSNITNFSNTVRYNARGEVDNNAVGGYFIVCHNNQLQGARAVILTRMRPVLAADTNGNGIPESDSADISSCAT